MSQNSIEHLEQLAKICDAKSFLSKEFLTWLWFSIEDTGGEIEIDLGQKRKAVEFWIDDKIIMEDPSANVHKHSLKGGNPSSSLEATAALVTGKTVTELKLGAIIDENEYSFTIGFKDLAPRSIALPKAPTNSEDPEITLHGRASSIAILANVVDGLFLHFLRARTELSWESTEVDHIREWIIQRGQGEITFH